MDLLDQRAEAYIALGMLDLAAQDANTMGKVASAEVAVPVEKKYIFQAQALNRKSVVQMRLGQLNSALKTAARALKAAQQTKQTSLIANSMLGLSEARGRTRKTELAITTAQQTLSLFKNQGNISGTGRALWLIALGFFDLTRVDESRSAAREALGLCQTVGDQYGMGNALIALSFTDIDLAERMEHLKWAFQAFKNAGYVERQATVLGNLALAYSALGLDFHARRLMVQAADINRKIGAKVGLAVSLLNLVETSIAMGDLDAARAYLSETADIVPNLGDPLYEIYLIQVQGRLEIAEGSPQEAVRYFQTALQHIQQRGVAKEHEYLTLLGIAHLANHDPSAALQATLRATQLHRSLSFAVSDNLTKQEFWWRHVQALTANQETTQARQALETAYDLLLEGIANVRDEGLRRNYLNKPIVNREIIAAWLEDGKKRKLPKERLFAHLGIESNIREPFKRLAETSLRLNALHTVAEIKSFIVEEATELCGGERVLLILEKDGVREVTESRLPTASKSARQAEGDLQKLLNSLHSYLDHARLTRAVQLVVPRKSGLNRLIAPLIAQNQLLGYVYVDMHSNYGLFDEADRDTLGMLANQAAVALDNAMLVEGLEQRVDDRTDDLNQRNAELAIINSISEAMAKTLDVKTITRIVGDKVRDIFNAESVGILLLDPRTNLIHSLYEFDKGEGGYIDYLEPIPLGTGLTSKVISSRLPLLLGTLEEQIANGAYLSPEQLKQGTGILTQSSLGVPIITGDRVLGVVGLGSYQLHAFDENHLRLLQTLSSNMGVAIENARLFEAEQQRVAELQIINTIQQGLAAELDFQAIIDLVGDKLQQVFATTDLGISWYDEKADLIHYLYFYEHGKRLNISPLPPKPGGIFDRMVQTRQPIVINSPEDDLKLGTTVIPGTDLSKSMISVPIISGDRVLGYIQIENYERENAFGESELRLLTTISSSLGSSLENARLFAETQRLFQAEQERVAELQVINTIQQGLAAELDFQAIIDLVGDKLRQVFATTDLGINWYDEKANLIHYLYSYEHGQRLYISPMPPRPGGLFERMVETRQPIADQLR